MSTDRTLRLLGIIPFIALFIVGGALMLTAVWHEDRNTWHSPCVVSYTVDGHVWCQLTADNARRETHS